ncbi:MAG: MFS transporter [Victivallales bacterium]|nr:MFS transporter [Victivallales bacterium]
MAPQKSHWKINIVMLWFSQLLIMAGYSAMVPFISLFIKNELGITDQAELAKYISAFSFFGTLGYVIFCPIWGALGDKFGIKPMLLRGTFVTAPIFAMMGYVNTPAMLIFLRFITASCAGTTAASNIMVVRTTPENRQGFALGLLSTAIWGGSMLGNFIGGLIIHKYTYLHAFWLCGVMYFIAGFAIIFTHDDMNPDSVLKKAVDTAAKGWRANFTTPIWLMLLLFLILGLIRNIETPYLALRVEEMTSKEEADYWTGIISAIVCIGAIIAGASAGTLADRYQPIVLICPIFIVSIIAMTMQSFGSSPIYFAASRTLLYVAAGGIQPVIQRTLSTITPKERRGTVFGASSSISSVGTMLAAVIGGVCYATIGIRGTFLTAAASYLVAFPIYFVIIRVLTRRR